MDTAITAPTVVRRVVGDDLAAAWDDLADPAGAVPFAQPGWLLPRAGAAGAPLEAPTPWCGPRLTGVLPVAGKRRRLHTPADWHTPWSEAVAEDPAALEVLASALARAGRPRVTVDFALAGEATAERTAAALAAAGCRLVPRARLESPYLILEGPWEGYLASLSAHRRCELRRRARRLEGAGAVTREVHDGGDRLAPLLEEAFAVEAAGWKGRAGTAIASDPAIARFYRRMAAWAAERGWLRLAFLRLDGRALAFDPALEAGGRHFLLKTGYAPAATALSPAFTGLSPGLLLRLHMLERSFATGLQSCELCGAAEPWKLQWAPATRPVLVIEAFAPTAAGSLAEAAARVSRFARVKAHRHRRRGGRPLRPGRLPGRSRCGARLSRVVPGRSTAGWARRRRGPRSPRSR